MDQLSTIAGGVLGFILGDIPGAVAGAELGHIVANGNPNLPMKRKSTSSRKTSKVKRGRSSAYRKSSRIVRRGKSLRKGFRRMTRGKRAGGPIYVVQDMSLVKFRMPGRRKAMKVSRQGRIMFTDTYQTIIDGNLGVQKPFVGRYFHHRDQLQQDLPDNAAIKNSQTASTSTVFQLNPNRGTTGGGDIAATAAPLSETIYCSRQETSMSLSNFENLACHVEVFWMLCKTDHTGDPLQLWGLDDQAFGFGQSNLVIPTLAAATALATPGYPGIDFYGNDPFTQENFKKYWKIVMKKEFILPPGKTVRIEFTRPINKLLKAANVSGNSHQKGLTFVPMFIFKPAPVVAKVTAENIVSVNTGPCHIGYMQYDTGIYHAIKEKTTPVNRAYTSNWVNTFANVTTQFIEGDGDQRAVIQAN